jgi:peptidoglycan hydrolase-like protein with peptidoglycan-binding domain
MVSYQCGARGPEVAFIQTKLKEIGAYNGPVDGDFGGGTESAVKAFSALCRTDGRRDGRSVNLGKTVR